MVLTCIYNRFTNNMFANFYYWRSRY